MCRTISILTNLCVCICTLVLCIDGSRLLYRNKRSNLMDEHESSPERYRRDQYASAYKIPKNHQLLLDYGWSPRQLNSFSTTGMLGMGSSQMPPTEYVYSGGAGAVSGEDDNAVSAGHNHGWGWGHKEHGKDCNSALGLLGILGLASYLQMNGFGIGNMNMNPMPPMMMGAAGGANPGEGGAPGGRRRRSLASSLSYSQLNESTALIVPYLLNLNHIREGYWPLECSPYSICMLSQTVSRGINKAEKQIVRATLRNIVEEVLIHPSVISTELEEIDFRKKVDWATKVGTTGESCDTHFKVC